MNIQLTLPLRLRDEATFSNFFPGNNQIVVDYLQQFITMPIERSVYLWGHPGVGCSHLLQACCQQIDEQGLRAVYLPLKQAGLLTPQILEGLETCALICLDNLEIISSQAEWEEAIFHLYNRLQMTSARLLIAAHQVPFELGLSLPDLLSRLSNMIIFQVRELTDDDKINSLQLRAQLRGLELSQEVGKFLLNHFPRDLPALFNLLEKLDKASLRMQHKLTVPFVKKILEG